MAFGNAHDDTDRMVAAGYDNGDVKVGYSMTTDFQSDHSKCPK